MVSYSLPVDSADTLVLKIFAKIALPRTVCEINALYTDIQDGCQIGQKNDF